MNYVDMIADKKIYKKFTTDGSGTNLNYFSKRQTFYPKRDQGNLVINETSFCKFAPILSGRVDVKLHLLLSHDGNYLELSPYLITLRMYKNGNLLSEKTSKVTVNESTKELDISFFQVEMEAFSQYEIALEVSMDSNDGYYYWDTAVHLVGYISDDTSKYFIEKS